MKKYILAYHESEQECFGVDFIGIFDTKTKAEEKQLQLLEYSTNLDKINKDIEDRNRKLLIEYVDDNLHCFIINKNAHINYQESQFAKNYKTLTEQTWRWLYPEGWKDLFDISNAKNPMPNFEKPMQVDYNKYYEKELFLLKEVEYFKD